MESSITVEIPKKQLWDKKNYEPLLLECLNHIPFFKLKGKGGFSATKSESNGECDAIGNSDCSSLDCYSLDFKLLTQHNLRLV